MTTEPRTWRNWAGTAVAEPARWRRPASVAQISAEVTAAAADGLTVRALGSGHSFTDTAACPGGVALDLSAWTGLVSGDPATGLVTVRSGTTVRELNRLLDAAGLAMANLGDIDVQTIAGALNTGTHGTGATLGGLATQVAAMELVLGTGELVSCSATERPDLFAAARVGLGAVGVVTTVTLRCVPAFTLAADERPMPLDEVLRTFGTMADENDFCEFYWFPYGRKALVKRNNRVPASDRPMPSWRRWWEYEVMENAAFGAMCRTGRRFPAFIPRLNAISSSALSARSYTDVSHRVFVTPRRVRFTESEYAVPRESLPDVLGELRAAVPRLRFPVMFPVEVRVAAADDIWLSTGYGRDSAYVAIHQYTGLPYEEYFDVFESVAAKAGGRPHWGKMHSQAAPRLRELYPRFNEFLAVRDQADPAGLFLNPYLTRVLGVSRGVPGDRQ